MKALRVVPLFFVVALAGCEDVYGIGGRDFEGFYSYAGTVDDAIGDAVVGEVTITRQRGRYADVSIDWSYIDNGEEVIRIQTEIPAEADLFSDGDIYFVFEGELFTDGEVVDFRLEHDGRLRGRTITGWWRLTTGLPTDDEGSFTASRN